MGDSESDSENGTEERVLPAKDVYLLMKKDYRISRNIRASWFFRHINSVLEFSPESCLEETNKELTVVGVVMEEEAVIRFGNDDSPNSSPSQTEGTSISFRLVPSTVIHFIAKRYRLVFVLDFSPSALSVDLKTGEVFADKIFDSLKKCLLGLVKPFPLPGTNLLFESELFITVIAHTPMVVCTTNQVLVQGIRVTAANVAVVLDAVRNGLQVFEQSLYNDINLPTPDMTNLGDSLSRVENSNPEQKPRTRNKSAESAINPEAGIINLLRQGFFALQLLPENSSAGIVVVTDGMLGVTDLNLFDTLLAQLRSSTIACSFLRIGQTQCARCSFGLVPHVELLQFISSTTFGTYIGDPHDEKEDYHRKLLIWSFQKSIREPLHVLPGYNNSVCSYINVYAHPLKDYPDLIPIERKRQMDVKLNTSLSSVLSIRLREGFTLRNIIFLRGETQIKVELALLWRDYVKIEYCATAAWPQDNSRQHQTHVEMFVEGSYEFLHDAFSSECSLTMSRWSPIRANRKKKFLIALTKLRQSDLLLSHLQGFASNPVNYKLPDSIKNGLSVFYIPLQSSTPTFNSQHNTKDAVFNQFVTFWKPVVHLDTKIWQKWMHSHRIGMVLEHDRPLSKYLHIPDSCGRFYFVFCRQAQLALQTLLQSWSTFVLVENTAYVKYLYEGESQSSKEHPTHFLLLRLSTSKAPCMTIKAAFLGGTSGSMRYKVLKELKTKVFALKFKQGGSQIEKSKKSPKQERETMAKRKPPLSREWSETPCCVMLTKPMENILISYERVPSDMTILEDPSRYFPSHMTAQQVANKTVLANAFNTLSRYLYHQRWIWTIRQGKVDISMQAVGKILSTLTKIRLQEGFHFASSNSGIVNMVLETDMRHASETSSSGSDVSRCVVQYVIFPPQVKTSCTSMSEDDMDMFELTEADGDLQIVTECWIEPQYGVVINSTPERQHWEGLTYKQIARAFYPKDLECVSSLVTFENLQYVCQHPAVFEDLLPWQPEGSICSNAASSSPYDDECHRGPILPNIHQMPLVFDILTLVPKSQQAELLFSSFILVKETGETFRDIKGSNNLLLNLFFSEIKGRKEQEIPLSITDCRRFLQLLVGRDRDVQKNPYPFDVSNVKLMIDKVPSQPQSPSKSPKTVADLEDIPQWKCFVSSASSNKLFIKFVPASYEDLLKLHCASVDTKRESLSVTREAVSDKMKVLENMKVEKQTSEDRDEKEVEGEKGTEDEMDNKATENEERKSKPLSYVIPVYIYECHLQNITDSLVNPWNFSNKEDIFEDVTFQVDEEHKSPALKKPSVDLSAFNKTTEEGVASPTFRIHHERHSTENSDSEDLIQQSNDLKEYYCSSFLNGVFQSLQQGFLVDHQDIEAAINNICEETHPLEIDTTSFLHTSCRHFQQLVEEAKATVALVETTEHKEDGLKRQISVRFADEVDGELLTTPSLPAVLQIPRGRIRLTAPSLPDKCEYYDGLHDIIRGKFLDIVNKWFKVVPSAPDFYFYCPDPVPMETNNEESDNRNVSDNSDIVKSEAITTEELLDDSIGFQEPEQDSDQKNNPDFASIASQRDSDETLSFEESEYDFCEELKLHENEDDSVPLFLHFTCTVKSGILNENVSVRKLVPCIEELCAAEEISVMEVNLADLKITLDINCLTYPSESDVCETRRIPYIRMSSYNSVGSEESPRVSECENTEVISSIDPGHQSGGDPLGNLPVQQHNAITKCKEELEWLLKDEIASSLRHLNPIRKDALQYVTEHIKNSACKGKPTCSFESVPLHFVYGSDDSLTKFREEFERLHMHGFRLIKEEDYYFAVRLKSHCLGHQPDVKALKNALVELSKEGSPATQNASLDSLNDPTEDSFLSKEAGVLRTFVSPRFCSPETFRNSGHVRQFSSDVSGSDEYPSPVIQFNRVSFEKQVSPNGTVELHQKEVHVSDGNLLLSDSKLIDSRRNSKESSTGQTFCFSARKDSNTDDTTSESASGPSSNTEGQLSNIAPLQPSNPIVTRSASNNDDLPDAFLRKSSSFAGFQNEQTTETFSRQESVASVLQLPSKPLGGTPQLPSLGRLRHSSAPSGHGTPRSKNSTVPQTPSWLSSRGSYTEEGYEGGTSDSEEGTTAFSDVSGLQHPTPKFWLILEVKEDRVDMYYHSRETGLAGESEDLLEQRKLMSNVKKNIESLCRKVNQLLLLNDLYETRMCKNLLVAEADEDVSWNVDTVPGKPPSSHSEDEDETYPGLQYLAAENKYLPGHFECESVMTYRFIVHPRLKTGTGRSNVSRGVQALRTVLNKFSVNNRKNMFVIKELDDSNSVYYLRLREVLSSNLSRQVSSISTEDVGLCDSASSMMFAGKREEMASDKDTDAISVTSVGSSTQRLPQDLIEVEVYGVQAAGTTLQMHLMDMLQKKLDDAVLDIISLQLIRNPNIKLMPHDIHFIQKPNQDVSLEIFLTIPGILPIPLSALMYYLKQNMSQFSHAPNYADNKSENRFQDKTGNLSRPIPDDEVFLYIRPQPSGGKGIACVRVSLVDGQRNLVPLLTCPRPSRTNYCKVETLEEFESLTYTAPLSPKRPSRAGIPGPTALVQFRIWERGSSDLDTLKEKLIGAMKHALNDVIMEYYFLTSSICQVPHQLHDILPTPALSAPSSPVITKVSESVEKRHSALSRKNSMEISIKSLSTSKTAPSPLQFMKDTFGSSRSRLMSPPPDSSSKVFEFPSVPSPVTSPTPGGSITDKGSDVHQAIKMYEDGERGSLCPIFTEQMARWLEYCHKQGAPAVNKLEQTFISRLSLDQFLMEFQSLVKTVTSGNVSPRIFRQEPDHHVQSGRWVQYNPCRKPLHTEETYRESSLDYKQWTASHTLDVSFIVIGRNVDQWQTSIKDMGEDEIADITMKQSQKDKAFPKQSFQRFAPYLLEKTRRESLTDQTSPDTIEMSPIGSTMFIPRQRLLFLLLKNRKLVLYTYNWAGDSTNLLIKSTTRIVQWQNARVSLLNSVVAQKMGLFNHCSFYDPKRNKKNPFAGTSTNLDDLIKCTAPPSDKGRRHNSMSTVVTTSYRAFDEVYKDLKPPKPLQNTEFYKMSDIIKQQCFQAQDLRLQDRREMEKLEKLRNLYLLWSQKSTAHMPIKEDVLHPLKQASRLLHYCATPLLFDPIWRRKVMKKYEVTQRQLSVSSTEKVRSRHSSGQSVSSLRAMRTNSQEGLKKRPVTTPTDSPVNHPRLHREEAWHIELRHTFLHQYIKYVQSLGFISITLQPNLHSKGTHKKRSSYEKLSVHEEEIHPPHTQSSTCYLHKAMPAGIMLMELSFREQYFCVEMFVCENTRLGIPINKHLKLLFVEECEKCKDLIHVHSFAHDFHLRCIQSCMQPVQAAQSFLRPQYHLTGFLRDFSQVYPYPPKFSRNYLLEDAVSISNLSTNGSDLYTFMVQNNKLNDLKKFEMVPSIDPEIDSEFFFVKATEYALVSHKTVRIPLPPKSNKPNHEDYFVGLVITQSPYSDTDRHTLKLNYFILLTSQSELFPSDPVETKTGEFKAMVLQELSDRSKMVPVKQHISVRKEVLKFQKMSKIHNLSLYNLLENERELARQKIDDMIERSEVKCRKDSLWQRMLIGGKLEEKDNLQKLEFEEFLELLGMSVQVSLNSIDSQLIPFLNMNLLWYNGLFKKLQTKYPDTHRCFSSQDGQVQYIVILNPNYVDMFSMLMTNARENRTFLGAVYRDSLMGQVDTLESPNLPVRSVQHHLEDFVNVCSYHLWSSML